MYYIQEKNICIHSYSILYSNGLITCLHLFNTVMIQQLSKVKLNFFFGKHNNSFIKSKIT